MMLWALFLDDERYPNEIEFPEFEFVPPLQHHWRIARNFHDAVWYINNYGMPFFISFDHDLGRALDGMDVAKWLVNYMMDENISPKHHLYFHVHSQNPVGAKNIQTLLDQFKDEY